MALNEHAVCPTLRINDYVSNAAFLAVGMDNSGGRDFVSPCNRCLTLSFHLGHQGRLLWKELPAPLRNQKQDRL